MSVDVSPVKYSDSEIYSVKIVTRYKKICSGKNKKKNISKYCSLKFEPNLLSIKKLSAMCQTCMQHLTGFGSQCCILADYAEMSGSKWN